MAVEFAGKAIPAPIVKNFLPARATYKKEQMKSEAASSSHPEEGQTPRNGWMGVDDDIPFNLECMHSKYMKIIDINTKGWPHNLPLTVTNYKLMLVLIDLIMNLDCTPSKYHALYEALRGEKKKSGPNVVSG